jgi:CRISPR-associated protein Csx14
MRHILLAVVGLSPQVVTETLFCLHQGGRRVDAVHLITTAPGRRLVLSDLLGEGTGHYHRFLEEYDIDPAAIDFSIANVHVASKEGGGPIEDIDGPEENEALLRLCLEVTWRLTASPDTAVWFSVAGGRKTMSACLTLAAQIYGRPQDRLYHVLVTPDFEGNRRFFYPPREPRTIAVRGKDGTPCYMDTRHARVHLVNMPLIHIGSRLSRRLLGETREPDALMRLLVRDDAVPLLAVDLEAGEIVFCGEALKLMPSRLALYAFFAGARQSCGCEGRGCETCFPDFTCIESRQAEIAATYRRQGGGTGTSRTGIEELDEPNFRAYKSKINAAIGRRFGPEARNRIGIVSVRPKEEGGLTRYGIPIDPRLVRVLF